MNTSEIASWVVAVGALVTSVAQYATSASKKEIDRLDRVLSAQDKRIIDLTTALHRAESHITELEHERDLLKNALLQAGVPIPDLAKDRK